jgi:tight adherence protein B
VDANQYLAMAASCAFLFAAVFLFAWWNVTLWDRFAEWLVADFTGQMRSVSMDTSNLPLYLRWWGFAMVGTFIVSLLLGIPLIGLAVVFLIYIAPRYALEYIIARRRSLLRDQMVGASMAMANAARAGLALAQALETISTETPQPLAAEFRHITQDYGRGRPLPDALRDAKDRLVLDGFTLFTSAILTCLDRGGRITDALERISKSLQENQRLERKLEADTATGRKVVILLTVFPVVFLLGFYLMDPSATGILFSTVLGQLVVVAVLALAYGAAHWARKILTIEL